MEIVIFSGISSKCEGDLKTSSEKFELQFIKNIAPYFSKVIVLSPNIQDEQEFNNISIIPVTRKNNFYVDYMSYLKNHIPQYIVFWGYNPSTIKQCLKCQKKGAKIIPFIYDTHLGALPDSGLKKYLIDLYYRKGIKLLNRTDGVILFQKEAHRLLKLRIPYVLSTVVAEGGATVIDRADAKEKFTVFYSGTINKYNGFSHFIDIAKRVEILDNDIQFKIYGDGELYHQLKSEAKGLNNVSLYGRVPANIIDREIKNADLLLNLRDTSSIVNKFAFPSKLIEYLTYRKLVLTTKFTNEEALYACTCPIEINESTSIAEQIVDIKQNFDKYRKKISMIEKYLQVYHNGERETKKIVDFIFKL